MKETQVNGKLEKTIKDVKKFKKIIKEHIDRLNKHPKNAVYLPLLKINGDKGEKGDQTLEIQSDLQRLKFWKVILNNIKFYEVDMIPFFKYFTENNINNSIQIPLQGIAPYIDYSIYNFEFIDNISIGVESISIQKVLNIYSGIVVGVNGLSSNNFGVVINTNLNINGTGVGATTSIIVTPNW
jgi:hypothetical protein